ncbi:MAG: ISL3 family transposase [Planctomycetota bacterium]|jgi:transposase|nr:ISL3 family transposase [Planctomycetota bacterium]
MDAEHLYETVLHVTPPWYVEEVRGKPSASRLGKCDEVVVVIAHGEPLACPECGCACPRHDSRVRRWRHLDTCEARTVLEADVPRVRCPEHGVRQISIPWAEGRVPYTRAFECWVIDLLLEGTPAGVARLTGLGWDAVNAIKGRAVDRGLSRRGEVSPRHIGVDETSAKKRHDYITVVSDQETGLVLHVSPGKDAESLGKFYHSLTISAINRIESVAMDMSLAYIAATKEHLPQSDMAICFDRFHVASAFSKALNKVRVRENLKLASQGDGRLVGTRHDWLASDAQIDGRTRRWFKELSASALQTSRAWAIKEAASRCWEFVSVGWARKAWKRLIGWIDRCRIPEIKKLSDFLKVHLWGILNAISFGVTNSPAEGINSRIQKLKARSCGFATKAAFATTVYFHLGGLDLYP